MEIVYGIIGCVGLVLFFVLIGVGMSKAKKSRSTCSKCKTQYKYDENISWTVLSSKTTTSGHEERTMEKVKIECHCPECGTVKQIMKEFCTAKYNSQYNSLSKTNLDEEIRKLFL